MLASTSRLNASALLDLADALLRFVTLLPPSSVTITILVCYVLRVDVLVPLKNVAVTRVIQLRSFQMYIQFETIVVG